MTLEEIKELIEVVQQSGVAELEVQRGENRVRIRRSNPPSPQEFVFSAPPSMVAPGTPGPVVAAPTSAMHASALAAALPAAPPASASEQDEDAELTIVKSPIVGTFYESGSPGAAPFVKVGDRVSPGQVLCIIESMKLMNEIESEYSGVVVRKLVENGKPVEYGQALYALRTS